MAINKSRNVSGDFLKQGTVVAIVIAGGKCFSSMSPGSRRNIVFDIEWWEAHVRTVTAVSANRNSRKEMPSPCFSLGVVDAANARVEAA
jgi:hypothetical protein